MLRSCSCNNPSYGSCLNHDSVRCLLFTCANCAHYSERFPPPFSAVYLCFQELLDAATKGDSELAESLLKKGISADFRDDSAATPLIIAAQNGGTETVELLLGERNNNIDARNEEGEASEKSPNSFTL